MKKKLNIKLTVCLTIIFIALNTCTVFADAPYFTVTQGPNDKFVNTQTAFEPSDVLLYPVQNPQGLCVDKNTGIMYIADTGNSRILVVKDNKVLRSIGENILQSPSGVFINDEGKVYVADYGRKKVFIFNKDGKLLQAIGKPTEPIYGKNNDFVPKKLTVDNRGNIYVISEGSVNGIIQLNNQGKFAGYIGSNKTDLSLNMILQRLFFTAKQKSQLFQVIPPSPTSITIDNQGLLYTVTGGIKNEAIKKLNITGDNILPPTMYATDAVIDISVDENGDIYTVDNYGYITVYDSFGNLLFYFGGKDSGQERTGLLKDPAAITVTDNGVIYVIDSERNIINVYKPTTFTNEVMQGVNLYRQGLYVQSQKTWQSILKMNSSFILSYTALAKAYFKQGNYQVALNDFKLAEDKKGYSDAFWQIRNRWIQNNISPILLILLIIYILKFIVVKIDKRYKILNKPRAALKKFKKIKIISELGFAFNFLKHPVDSYYDLKHSMRASVFSATILYLWFFILQLTGIGVTGFVFSKGNPSNINLTSVLTTTFAPLILWVVANYLVSSISEGEGRLRDIYIGTIYSLTPYLIMALPIQIISNVLTLNEGFIYSFSMLIAEAWSVLLLIIMIKEIHDYSLKETIKNILVTIFTIVLIVVILFILVILFNEEVDFIKSIIQELMIRV